MYRAELNPILEQGVTEILESMFFMGVMGELQTPPSEDPSVLAMKLHFTGAFSGSLGLRMLPAAAQSMAANFLGEEATEIDTVRSLEVMGELSNMVCGSFLSAYASNDVFDLSHPARDLDPMESDAWTASRHIELEEGTLFVWLILAPQAETSETLEFAA